MCSYSSTRDVRPFISTDPLKARAVLFTEYAASLEILEPFVHAATASHTADSVPLMGRKGPNHRTKSMFYRNCDSMDAAISRCVIAWRVPSVLRQAKGFGARGVHGSAQDWRVRIGEPEPRSGRSAMSHSQILLALVCSTRVNVSFLKVERISRR